MKKKISRLAVISLTLMVLVILLGCKVEAKVKTSDTVRIGYTDESTLSKEDRKREEKARKQEEKDKEPIVDNSDACYSYLNMQDDLEQLERRYEGKVYVTSIGKSYDGRELYCIRIGSDKAKKKVIIDAGIHGREYFNCQGIMSKVEELLKNYNKAYYKDKAVYVLPMLNPDGVTIAQYGASGLKSKELRSKVRSILGNTSYRLWKSNANGVDLNRNFTRGWAVTKLSNKPSIAFYYGKSAGSEKETKAIMKFIGELKGVVATINFHSMGRIIYWNFNTTAERKKEVRRLAVKANQITGFQLASEPSSSKYNGGLSDWLVFENGIPTVTLETGTSNTVGQYKSIKSSNDKMIEAFIKMY